MKVMVLAVALGLVLSGMACGAGSDLADDVQERQARGEEVFVAAGCRGCHVEAGESVAPSLQGLYGGEVVLEGGVTVLADEEYLRESILSPGARLVEGYRAIMPGFQGLLTDEQVDALIGYIRTLED